jgi:hypothetical protein
MTAAHDSIDKNRHHVTCVDFAFDYDGGAGPPFCEYAILGAKNEFTWP